MDSQRPDLFWVIREELRRGSSTKKSFFYECSWKGSQTVDNNNGNKVGKIS